MTTLSVRLRLALTVAFTGLATALGVLVATALAFERFEREAAYARADAFLGRAVALHDDLPAQQRRDPEGFVAFLKSLLLFEPDSQLYLLAPDGTVLASTGTKPLPAGFRVALAPVQQAAAAAAAVPARSSAASSPGARPPPARAARGAAYVMGDDPEHMEDDAVIAARALAQPSIRPVPGVAGYLYLVCRKPGLPPSRLARLAEHLAGPALGPVLGVVLLASLLAAWIIAAVTRPLAVLSAEVAAAAQAGFDEASPPPAMAPPGRPHRLRDDEFGRLQMGFQALLGKLRAQWDRLRRLDAFRRESVSNLSHDLRSPLTAAAASLETLQRRWQSSDGAGAGRPDDQAEAAEDRRLVEVALRNTHSAARLVRALGDLAVLDEAGFRLRLARIDLVEMLDDIAVRFAERAAAQGVSLRCDFGAAGAGPAAEPLAAEVDVELLERALANLLDNALRHTPGGGEVVLAARPQREPAAGPDSAVPRPDLVRLTVRDTGGGIAPDDLAHLFDRHFRGRHDSDKSRSEGGKGLGLAIVQRIVELHAGQVDVTSRVGAGTTVTIDLPASAAAG
ncbi:MAG: HAMP domain-containing histidine kinase [Rubrivivax sp.]|nr:HAMP domain-containing histidine kinase [Rubrivivax sp.]